VDETELASFYKVRRLRVDEFDFTFHPKVYITDASAWKFVFFAVGLDCDTPIMDSLLQTHCPIVEEEEEESAWEPDSADYRPTSP
jgi:hypothetical protein